MLLQRLAFLYIYTPSSPFFSSISFTTPSFSSYLPHCPLKVWWHSADDPPANPAKIIDYQMLCIHEDWAVFFMFFFVEMKIFDWVYLVRKIR
jgi:hypothetical protein